MRPRVVIVLISVDGVMRPCFDGIVRQDYANLALIVNQKAAVRYSDNPMRNKYENCHRNRNEARDRALRSDGEYFLFLDDDVVLPAHAVTRLVSHRKDVIGGWYPILGTNRYVCGRWVADNAFLNFTNVHRSVVRTDTVGLGCALVSRKVMEQVPFEAGLDLECVDAHTGGKMLLGECGVFGNRVDQLGLMMYMDGEVICQHLPRRQAMPHPKGNREEVATGLVPSLVSD